MEDDLIKVGWGDNSTLKEWDAIMAWVLKMLDQSALTLHILMDFTEIYVVSTDIFHPEFAARLAVHPSAGSIMLVNHNPAFVHFVNQEWIAQIEAVVGIRAFLDTSDALAWLRGVSLG